MKWLLALLVCSPFASINASNSKKQLETFYEEFLCEEKDDLASAGLTRPCTLTPPSPPPGPPGPPIPPVPPPPPPPPPLPPTSQTDFVPLVISNNTGLPDNEVYVLIKGIHPTGTGTNGNQCYVDFSGDPALGSYFDITVGNSSCTFSRDHSYLLSSLPSLSPGYRLVYLPYLRSGRIYFSIKDPVWLDTISAGGGEILDPSPTSFRDVSYYTLYDKCEFSLVSTASGGMTPPTNPQDYQLFINPTAVDFFCLPILVQTIDQTTNMPICFNAGSCFGNFCSAGLNLTRSQVFSHVVPYLNFYDVSPTKVWDYLLLSYLNNPYSPASGSNIAGYLRISSPGKSTPQTVPPPPPPPPPSPPATFYEDFPAFPYDYLLNGTTYGYNYVDQLFDFYTTNTVKIDVSEIVGTGNCGSCTCGPCAAGSFIFTGQVIGSDFVFNSTTTCMSANCPSSVSFSKPTTSFPFYAGAGLFSPPEVNNTPQAIITRQLTSAFDVGILPIALPSVTTPDNLLNAEFFQSYCSNPGYYTNNSHWSSNTGPWYDLYSKTLHSFHAPLYTFAYDDQLGQSGLLDPVGSQTPYIYLTLGNLSGNVIPNPYEDATSYTVTFQPGANRPVGYRQGTSGNFTMVTSNQVVGGIISNSSNKFQVKLQDADCVDQILTIYIKYQNIVPECISNSALAQGVDIIVPNPNDLSQVTIAFPGALAACPSPPCLTPPCPSPCPSPSCD